MTDDTSAVHTPSRYMARREYRHRTQDCGRLLFVGYLPPGTHIEIRCPACGRVHVIHVEPLDYPAVDVAQQF